MRKAAQISSSSAYRHPRRRPHPQVQAIRDTYIYHILATEGIQIGPVSKHNFSWYRQAIPAVPNLNSLKTGAKFSANDHRSFSV